jgi:hypothetical protein
LMALEMNVRPNLQIDDLVEQIWKLK